MAYLLFFFSLCCVVGVVGVASNPAPYYGVVGLVVGVVGGSGLVISLGASFVGLVLFLIYLGGMLVVFAYSVALAAEAYPEGWFGGTVVIYVFAYLLLVLLVVWLFGDLWDYGLFSGVGGVEICGFRSDFSGVMLLFLYGGGFLLLCVLGLLLALLVVFELVRGYGRGALRVP